jgi:hypothetical protein
LVAKKTTQNKAKKKYREGGRRRANAQKRRKNPCKRKRKKPLVWSQYLQCREVPCIQTTNTMQMEIVGASRHGCQLQHPRENEEKPL